MNCRQFTALHKRQDDTTLLAVMLNVPKRIVRKMNLHQVYELAKWRNSLSLAMPTEVIVRVPTAELSPNQKDQDSLPPYAILDGILALYLDEQKSEAEIVAAGYAAETVRWAIKRYHSQAFKRKQLAPEIAI